MGQEQIQKELSGGPLGYPDFFAFQVRRGVYSRAFSGEQRCGIYHRPGGPGRWRHGDVKFGFRTGFNG